MTTATEYSAPRMTHEPWKHGTQLAYLVPSVRDGIGLLGCLDSYVSVVSGGHFIWPHCHDQPRSCVLRVLRVACCVLLFLSCPGQDMVKIPTVKAMQPGCSGRDGLGMPAQKGSVPYPVTGYKIVCFSYYAGCGTAGFRPKKERPALAFLAPLLFSLGSPRAIGGPGKGQTQTVASLQVGSLACLVAIP